MKEMNNKYLKGCFKGKVKITLAALVAFFITGQAGYAATLDADDRNEINTMIEGHITGAVSATGAITNNVVNDGNPISNAIDKRAKAAVAPVETRVGVVESTLTGIITNLGNAQTDITALQTGKADQADLDAVKKQLDTSETGSFAETVVKGLGGLEGRVTTVETDLGNLDTRVGTVEAELAGKADAGVVTAALGTKADQADLDKLKEELDSTKPGTYAEGVANELKAIKTKNKNQTTRLNNLNQKIKDEAKRAKAAEAALDTRVTTVEGDVANIKGDVTAIQGDVTTIKGDVATLQTDKANQTDLDNLDNRVVSVEKELDAGVVGSVAHRVGENEKQLTDHDTRIKDNTDDIADINNEINKVGGINDKIKDLVANKADLTKVNEKNTEQDKRLDKNEADIKTNAKDIADEKLRATGEEGKIRTAISDEKSRAMSEEGKLDSAIKQNDTKIGNNTTAITNETSRAMAKETELDSAIKGEKAERIAKDDLLNEKITNEIAKAREEEAKLQKGIDKNAEEMEKQKDKNKEGTFANLIEKNKNDLAQEVVDRTKAVSDEQARAELAEQANKDAIGQEETRAKKAEQQNADNLVKETDRAKKAEKLNADNIVLEKNRAKKVEKQLKLDLTHETERAEGVEAGLRTDVDKNKVDINQNKMDINLANTRIGNEEARSQMKDSDHDNRLDGHDTRLDTHKGRLDGHDTKLNDHETRVATIETYVDGTDAAKERVAFGLNNKVTGKRSTAVGHGNIVNGNKSGAFGDPNVVNGNESYAVGNDNTIEGDRNFVVGNNVTVAKEVENSVVLGHNSTVKESNVVSVGSKGGERRVVNVADGRIDSTSTDAVNGRQAHQIKQDLRDVKQESRHIGALSAAMAGLHPMSYNPNHKSQVMAAIGNYRDKSAVAVGMAYHIKENLMVSGSLALSNTKRSKLMSNVGVTYRFGGEDRARTKLPAAYDGKELSQIHAMQNEMDFIKGQNQKQAKELKELRTMMNKVLRNK